MDTNKKTEVEWSCYGRALNIFKKMVSLRGCMPQRQSTRRVGAAPVSSVIEFLHLALTDAMWETAGHPARPESDGGQIRSMGS